MSDRSKASPAILTALLLLAAVAAHAQEVQYRISFPEPEHHWMLVEATFPGLPDGVLQVHMSRSSPGRYALHEFTKTVVRSIDMSQIASSVLGGARSLLNADDAVAKASALGMKTGSAIYLDMEAYDTTNTACNDAVLTYVRAFSKQLRARTYRAGYYGFRLPDANPYEVVRLALEDGTVRAGYVRAPGTRGEEFFDPGAKYHVPANTPYARYFLSYVLQFQFHRALAKAADCTTPLHRCSIYGSAEAGKRLKSVLAMGTRTSTEPKSARKSSQPPGLTAKDLSLRSSWVKAG